MATRRTTLNDADTRWPFPKPQYAKYACPYCGAGFADIRSLVLHRNRCQQAREEAL
jgi:hypothetical protein